MKYVLDQYRAVDPPLYVLALVAFAVLIMPGGIPLTLLAAPFYVRRRARLLRERLRAAGGMQRATAPAALIG